MTNAPAALADRPANCTGADYAAVSAGVAASMSTYMFTHPEFNDFITDLEASSTSDESTARIVDYFTAHPQTKADTEGIRAPLADFDRRCEYGPYGHVLAQ